MYTFSPVNFYLVGEQGHAKKYFTCTIVARVTVAGKIYSYTVVM